MCKKSTILKEYGWAERPSIDSSNHTYIQYFVGVVTTFSWWDTPIRYWEHNVTSSLGSITCDYGAGLRVVTAKAWSSQGLCSSSGTPWSMWSSPVDRSHLPDSPSARFNWVKQLTEWAAHLKCFKQFSCAYYYLLTPFCDPTIIVPDRLWTLRGKGAWL